MKSVLLFICVFITIAASAQVFPGIYGQRFQSGSMFQNDFLRDSVAPKKWSLNKYSGISTTFSVWKGGSASVVSAPLGLQLNRRLNNNLYAFAGVNVAPSYINFRSSFINPNSDGKFTQGNSFMNNRPGSFGVFSRAELGLMYTNDERTFQISGSFGVERNQFPTMRHFQPINQQIQRQPVLR